MRPRAEGRAPGCRVGARSAGVARSAEEPAGEVDEAAALELEEQVHDEVARLRRLRTAELAGCMGAAADLAMLLGAAELVSARAAADG